MRWDEVRSALPERWLVIEALGDDRYGVVAVGTDPLVAAKRARELSYVDPRRSLHCVHTSQRALALPRRLAA